MSELSTKLQKALAHWDRDYTFAMRHLRARWLEGEVAHIAGMLHRSTGLRLGDLNRVLQVGAGPVDVIDYWPAAERHAIDPLAEEYKAVFHELQAADVEYVSGVGENLPYEDNYFDLAIIRNALDHTYDAAKTLREINRVLAPQGALYVWVYLYRWRGSLIYRSINALTKRYETEPWAFTLPRMERLLSQTGFRAFFPTVERRPMKTPAKGRFLSRSWTKQLLRSLLGFIHDRAFECVAVPIKGGRRTSLFEQNAWPDGAEDDAGPVSRAADPRV